MEVFKILGVGLITAIAAIVVRQVKPDIGIIITLTGGVIIILMLAEYVNNILQTFEFLVEKTGIDRNIFSLVLKIIGIGYLTEFGANLCADAGTSSLSDKILLAGKVIILSMSLPIIKSIIDIIAELLP